MRLYLVRHGKADFGAIDSERPLSDRGRQDIEAVASHLAEQAIAPERVLHSGLVRARQTAEILAAALAPTISLEELSGIEPWGDVEAFAETAAHWDQDTMVCGHEPFMGEAVSRLVAGDADAGLVDVKTGTVMALERDHQGHGWHLRWVVTPRIVRGPKTEEHA